MKRLLVLLTLFTVFVIGCSKEFHVDVKGKGVVKDFDLKDFDGKITKSDTIFKNGKETLFVVAAEWCPHCRTEAPEIERFYNEYKDKVNIVVVYSNSGTNLENTKKYVKENGYTYPVYYDEDGSIIRAFGVEGFPFNLKIVDGKVEKELELPFTYDKMVAEYVK